jgi:hypothetical protein
MNRHFRLQCVVLTLVAACGPIDHGTALQSPDPDVRMNALLQAGSSGDESLVPAIIPSLQSDDPLVRWTAQQSLHKLTGTTLGYQWSDSPNQRATGVQKWVQWCHGKNLSTGRST